MLSFVYFLRNLILFLAVLTVGGFFLTVKIDRFLNYRPVQATVLDFSKSCRPLSNDQAVQASFDASTDFTHGKLGPCPALAQFGIAENSFQMSGRSINLRVDRVWRASVRYISPADGKPHESTVDLGPKDGEGLVSGKILTLLASKSEADLLQEP